MQVRRHLTTAIKIHFYILKASVYIRTVNKHPSSIAKLWCNLQVYTSQISNTHTHSGTVYMNSCKGNVKLQLEKVHESKVWAKGPLPSHLATWPSLFFIATIPLAPSGCPTCPNSCPASPKHFKLKMFQTHFFTFPTITKSLFPLEFLLRGHHIVIPVAFLPCHRSLESGLFSRAAGSSSACTWNSTRPISPVDGPSRCKSPAAYCKRRLLLLPLIHTLLPLPTWQVASPSTQNSPAPSFPHSDIETCQPETQSFF